MSRASRAAGAVVAVLVAMAPAAAASGAPPRVRREQMLAFVDYLERLFQERYAPAGYKRETLNWDVRTEAARLRERVLREPAPDAAEFRRALYQFFRSPRDIHTSIGFDDARAVWLGLQVKRVEGVYRVAWVDRAVLPVDRYPIELGDEVVSLDDIPIGRVVDQTKSAVLYRSTPAFENAFAEFLAFYRAADEWGEIPGTGSEARLKLRRGAQTVEVLLHWMDDAAAPPSERSPFRGKTRRGYLPALGNIVWTSPAGGQFPAYVFDVEGRSYGYIRLYTLEVESRRQVGAVREINQDVDEFQRRKVDAVVLDEFGNGGGDFLFGAALLSRFASKPLHLPRQQYLLENDGSVAGVGSRPAIERFAARLGAIRTNEDAARFMNADPIFAGALSFLPRSLASIRGVTDFFQFFLEQPAAGAQSLLSPHYEIQEAVVPDASLGPAFQGPLLLLIDEETLSAPEFLAAALVDGGRAEAFGTRTSGAGGDQRWISRDRVCPQGQDRDERLFTECVPKKISGIMRNLGVAGFGYTVTLGVRVLADGTLGEKIENRGVSPQIEYAVTESDLRESFRPMAARIVRVLRSPDFLK